jgi:hypothetical protein
MIAAVSPCASSADHTINTLRYADRVKEKPVGSDTDNFWRSFFKRIERIIIYRYLSRVYIYIYIYIVSLKKENFIDYWHAKICNGRSWISFLFGFLFSFYRYVFLLWNRFVLFCISFVPSFVDYILDNMHTTSSRESPRMEF